MPAFLLLLPFALFVWAIRSNRTLPIALLTLCAPALALAQDAAPVAPSPWASALAWLLSPTGMVAAIGVLGSGLGLLLGNNAVRRRRVALAVYHAFHIVEDLRAELGPGKLDKPLEGLKQADAWLVAQGWRPLKPGEQDLAKLAFKAMNAQADAAKALVAPNLPASVGIPLPR